MCYFNLTFHGKFRYKPKSHLLITRKTTNHRQVSIMSTVSQLFESNGRTCDFLFEHSLTAYGQKRQTRTNMWQLSLWTLQKLIKMSLKNQSHGLERNWTSVEPGLSSPSRHICHLTVLRGYAIHQLSICSSSLGLLNYVMFDLQQ